MNVGCSIGRFWKLQAASQLSTRFPPHGDHAPGIPGRSGDRIGIGGAGPKLPFRCSGWILTTCSDGRNPATPSPATSSRPLFSSLPRSPLTTTNSSPLHPCCNFNSGNLGAPDARVGDARKGCGSGFLSILPWPCATLLRPRLRVAASPVDGGVTATLESAKNANSLVFSSEEANVAPISRGCRLP